MWRAILLPCLLAAANPTPYNYSTSPLPLHPTLPSTTTTTTITTTTTTSYECQPNSLERIQVPPEGLTLNASGSNCEWTLETGPEEWLKVTLETDCEYSGNWCLFVNQSCVDPYSSHCGTRLKYSEPIYMESLATVRVLCDTQPFHVKVESVASCDSEGNAMTRSLNYDGATYLYYSYVISVPDEAYGELRDGGYEFQSQESIDCPLDCPCTWGLEGQEGRGVIARFTSFHLFQRDYIQFFDSPSTSVPIARCSGYSCDPVISKTNYLQMVLHAYSGNRSQSTFDVQIRNYDDDSYIYIIVGCTLGVLVIGTIFIACIIRQRKSGMSIPGEADQAKCCTDLRQA